MNTQKLARIYELRAQILRECPHNDLEKDLQHVLDCVRQQTATSPARTNQTATQIPEAPSISPDFIQHLSKMNLAEMESVLRASDLYKDRRKAKMQALARSLGLKVSNQTKEVLLQMVIQHFEARRMDSLIRTHRTLDDMQIEVEVSSLGAKG